MEIATIFLSADADFDLEPSQVTLQRESPQATIQLTLPQEDTLDDDEMERFTIVLSDAFGLAASNLFFRDAVVNIEDVGM